MRRRGLVAILCAAAAAAGCGGEEPRSLADRLRDGDVRVFAWGEDAVAGGCRTEAAARSQPGTALRARGGPAGCWVVVRGRPLAGMGDARRVDEDGERVRVAFSGPAARRVAGVGEDGHVGVALGDELVEVVHPSDGAVELGRSATAPVVRP